MKAIHFFGRLARLAPIPSLDFWSALPSGSLGHVPFTTGCSHWGCTQAAWGEGNPWKSWITAAIPISPSALRPEADRNWTRRRKLMGMAAIDRLVLWCAIRDEYWHLAIVRLPSVGRLASSGCPPGSHLKSQCLLSLCSKPGMKHAVQKTCPENEAPLAQSTAARP